jgi:hypothetical protein
MLNIKFLKYRLPILCVLLFALEAVNLKKLATAMSWTNDPAWLGVVAALTLGCFLVFSIIASSFSNLDGVLKARFERAVVGLFLLQTALVCIESFLISQTMLPAEQIAELFYTPVEATRRVVALGEGASLNIAALAFWQVVANLWRKEIEKKEELHKEFASYDPITSSRNGVKEEKVNAR